MMSNSYGFSASNRAASPARRVGSPHRLRPLMPTRYTGHVAEASNAFLSLALAMPDEETLREIDALPASPPRFHFEEGHPGLMPPSPTSPPPPPPGGEHLREAVEAVSAGFGLASERRAKAPEVAVVEAFQEAAQPAAHPTLDTRHAPLAAVRGVGGFSPVVMADAPGGATSPVQHSPQNAFIPVRERYNL